MESWNCLSLNLGKDFFRNAACMHIRAINIKAINLNITARTGVMSIAEYFANTIIRIKNEIEKSSEEYLLSVDPKELAKYYTQKYSLPLIEKDESRKITIEKEKSAYKGVSLRICYPTIPKENLGMVIKRYASTRFMSGLPIQLQGDWLVTFAEMGDERTLKMNIENLEKVIGWKNSDVRAGNERIRNEISTYIESRQKILKQQYEKLEAIIEKVQIPLTIKREEALPIVDFGVKKELRPLIKPKPKEQKELVLNKGNVGTLINYIRNSCLSFEKTPKVYAKHEEEELRDIILGNLNAIFEGEATGETFSKLGKTDIYLRISKGNILIVECKYWDGKRKYVDGIDQLFRYLTWRENYGVLVTFAARKGFTEVIRKAKEATQEHDTFVKGTMSESGVSEFVTRHRFPEDVEKKVIIHHLFFNLFVGG